MSYEPPAERPNAAVACPPANQSRDHAGGPSADLLADSPGVRPNAISPIAVLARMEERARAVAVALPQEPGSQTTTGRYIGFRIAEHRLLAAMQDIIEILPYPDLSRVPGAKPWLRGISQIRGRLVSVIDTSMFLGGPPTPTRRGCRLLVVQHDEILAGMVVDEVFGMKQALGPSTPWQAPAGSQWLAAVVASRVEVDASSWGMFELRRLIDDPEFLRASV